MKKIVIIAAALLAIVGIYHVQASPLVVTSPSKSSKTMSRQEVTWIFTMRTRVWSDGTRITVLYQDPTKKAHQDFCTQVLDMSPTKFQQIVNLYVNQGNSRYFKQVADDAAVIDIVSRSDGAIGYVNTDTVAVKLAGQTVELLHITD